MKKISIDGNICSGKTFYLKLLEKDGYHVHYDETFNQSQMAQKYSMDMKRYSLGYHLQLLYNYSHYEDKDKDIHIFESSPYVLKNVYGELTHEKGCFDADEYKIYEKYSTDFGWIPDVVIYLYCNPIICHERIKLCHPNNNVNCDYLKDLHLKFETIFDELNTPITLYKVNAQEETESVYHYILDILSKIKN
jgi:deoxyadenosine/deoxycytidine kinase